MYNAIEDKNNVPSFHLITLFSFQYLNQTWDNVHWVKKQVIISAKCYRPSAACVWTRVVKLLLCAYYYYYYLMYSNNLLLLLLLLRHIFKGPITITITITGNVWGAYYYYYYFYSKH